MSALVEENNHLLARVRQRARQNHILLSRSVELMEQFINSFCALGVPTYNAAGAVAPRRRERAFTKASDNLTHLCSAFLAASISAPRSLQTQQQGVEVAGQNLANVNNAAYARQRLVIQTSTPLPTSIGPEGTGRGGCRHHTGAGRAARPADPGRDQHHLFAYSPADRLAVRRSSGRRAAPEQQFHWQHLRRRLHRRTGQRFERPFNALQTLSTAPSSMTNRQAVIGQAQHLASQFNQVDQQLSALNGQLNQSVQTDVSSANQLLSDIAGLNKQIVLAQASGGTANDLIDLREQKIESLAQLVNIQPAATANGEVNISVNGQLLVSGSDVQDTLQTYDAGGGQLLVRTATSGTALTLTGGSIQGTIEARDGALKSLQDGLNTLASQLISQVNDCL